MELAPKLQSPEEELAYLRAQVAEKERDLAKKTSEEASLLAPLGGAERLSRAAKQLEAHKAAPTENVLAPSAILSDTESAAAVSRILGELSLGGNERAVAELARTAEEHGIKNALGVAERARNPGLEDDFHRYLVRLIAIGEAVSPKDERAPHFADLHMTLYEIALPEPKEKEKDRERPLKELLSAMEQLYAGLMSVGEVRRGEPNHFVLELAIPASQPYLAFYVAVPNSKRNLFEKQLLAIFPNALIAIAENDYNVFVEGGVAVGSSADFSKRPALPLKDYTEFDYDPLNAILNAFSKMEHAEEGAALQIVVQPVGDRRVAHYRKMLQALRKGKKRDEAFSVPEGAFGEVMHDIGKTLFSTKPKNKEKEKEAETRQIEENKIDIEMLEKKLAAPIVDATVRIVVSAKEMGRAHDMQSELEAAFNQFGHTHGNTLTFSRKEGSRLRALFRSFTFREPGHTIPLSLRELTSLYHFPPKGIDSSPHLKQSRFTDAPAPIGLPTEGALLGVNLYRGQETVVRLSPDDRLRHLYVIGQTGTGKTGFMKGMIAEDMRNGDGCCFIDPHGNDIVHLLALVPPERYEDVIYFDPANLSRPFGLNLLEYDPTRPEQKTFIVNELLAIFRRLYGDVPESMGPAFEQYFRNATQLVMEDPESGSTLMDVVRVFANQQFRDLKLSRSKNPIVNQFWRDIVSQVDGDVSLKNIVPYITNKFDDFTANDYMRPIIAQQESSFNFREVIDQKKILLVNLSKGRLGERNANMLGLIIVGKLFMAALSRADNPQAVYPPFYLYMDEFQNITTDSIPGILSEARKYKLSLTMAHQFLTQIEEMTRDAVFGNVGNMVVFRVGEEDAEFFEKQFAPTFDAHDFVNIGFRSAYAKILAHGVPQKPFNIRTPDLPAGNMEQVNDLMQLSSLTYGRDRAIVEDMIQQRFFN